MIAVDCGGVAFSCSSSMGTIGALPAIGQTVTLYTHLSVREDGMELFGFATKQELQYFRLLIGVNGVGPKAALSLLSAHKPEAIALFVASGDAKALTKAPGIGTKIAQRIIMELKDKLGAELPDRMPAKTVSVSSGAGFGGNIAEAVSALAALGFSAADAAKALQDADPAQTVEDLVRLGLRRM